MSEKKIEVPVIVKTPSAWNGALGTFAQYKDRFGSIFKNFARHPWVLATIAVVGAIGKCVSAFREKEVATNGLRQALINQGIYSRDLVRQYAATAESIRTSSAFSESEITQAQAQLQPYLGQKKVSKELLAAVADLASAKQIELAAAADVVGKSIGTGTNALRRHGITLADGLSPQEKLISVIKGIESKWKGQAQAQLYGLGAITAMTNAFTRLMATLGERVAPHLEGFAKGLKNMAERLSEHEAFLNAVTLMTEFLGFSVSFLATTLSIAATAITTAFGSVYRAAIKLVRGSVMGAFEEVGHGIKNAADSTRQQLKDFIEKHSAVVLAENSRRRVADGGQLQALSDAAGIKKSQQISKDREWELYFKAKSDREAAEDLARERLKNNERLQLLNQWIAKEKDATERLRLELEKRKLIQAEIGRVDEESEEKRLLFGLISDKATFDLQKDTFANLAELRNSKIGPLIAAGKIAAIASISYNLSIAIDNTIKVFQAIPPPVGQILAGTMAGLLALYAAEQIQNISDVSLDNPGRIGHGLRFSWDSFQALINSVAYNYAHGYEIAADTIAQTLSALLGGDVGKAIGDAISFFGDVLDFLTLGDVTEAIGNLIGDVIGAIGDFFGLAEGGVITYAGNHASVVPLQKAGINLRTEVNVKIVGGLIPSQREATRLASIIDSAIRSQA